MSMGYDKSKFKLSETFNNSDGKTSGSGFIGVISGLVACAAFIVVLVGWWMGKPDVLEVFDKILQLELVSAVLLGVRKVTGTLSKKSLSIDSEEEK